MQGASKTRDGVVLAGGGSGLLLGIQRRICRLDSRHPAGPAGLLAGAGEGDGARAGRTGGPGGGSPALNPPSRRGRMPPARLRGRVRAPVVGEPMIARQVERLRRAALIDTLVVATSTDASDDELAAFCGDLGVEVFRGAL